MNAAKAVKLWGDLEAGNLNRDHLMEITDLRRRRWNGRRRPRDATLDGLRW